MTLSLRDRLGFLKTLDSQILARRAEIEAALAADFHKAPFEVMTSEIAVVRHEIRTVRAWAADFLREKAVGVPLSLWPGLGRVAREPRGRVLVFSPWNFPFQLALAPVVGAVAAGNTVVLKPSELTPATSALVETLVAQSFPADLVQVVQGGADTASQLLTRVWDLIFFTGSPAVGRIVARAAAETLSPVVLELGGKSPAVVLDGADLEVAARRIVWGKVMNAGQTCVAPDYALVPRAQMEAFVEACQRALKSFFPQGAAASPDYASLIHERAFDRLTGLIDPARVAAGGGSDRSRRFLEPTILREVTWSDAIMAEEVFGPILPVLVHDGPEDARSQVLKAPDPLAAYVFGPAKEARRLLISLPAGGGAVNDVVTHFIHPGLPFGGRATSGLGQYHGTWSLEAFTRPRGRLEQPRRWDWPFRYPPYGPGKSKVVDILLR